MRILTPYDVLLSLAVPALTSANLRHREVYNDTETYMHPSSVVHTSEMQRMANHDDFGLIAGDNSNIGWFGDIINERTDNITVLLNELVHAVPLKVHHLNSSVTYWEEFQQEVPDRMQMHVSSYEIATESFTKSIRDMQEDKYPLDTGLLTLRLIIHHILLAGVLFHICPYPTPPDYLTGPAFDMFIALIDVLPVDVRDRLRFKWDFTETMPFLKI